MKKRPRLTRKQKQLVKQVLLDPQATPSELAQRTDYYDRANVHKALNSKAVKSELERFKELMDQREKLSLGKFLDKLEEGLDSVEVKELKVEGSIVKVKAEMPDQAMRHKWWESGMKIRGILGPEAAAGQAQSGPVNIAIILAGGGTDAEKAATVDVMLALRAARGLHPTENRLLTAEEAKELGRKQ